MNFHGRSPITQAQMDDFRKKLSDALAKKNWNGSDLARAAFGAEVTKEGYTVAKGRDRVSAYLSGKTYPAPRTMEKLAKALGVKVDDLAPGAVIDANARQAFNVTMIDGHGDKVHVSVDTVMSMKAATAIMQILAAEKGAK